MGIWKGLTGQQKRFRLLFVGQIEILFRMLFR